MHIFFSVGEPSGDLHAAKVITELRRRQPDVVCSGFGGPLMEQAGSHLLFRLTDLAVMGIVDVIPLLWRFICLVRQARRFLATMRPDAVVLVDYPGFNWWIARAARRLGIPVFYYLPPQLWAWAPWRIRKMRRLVDQVLCCLPFEQEWYERRAMPAHYVGHPFFDEVAERTLDAEFIADQRSRVNSRGLTVAILPGSRNHEIALNFDVQLRIMANLYETHPRVRFLVACYKETQLARCREKLARSGLNLPIELRVGKTSEIIELADMCLMVSGSVSLEVMCRQTPAVVLYRVGLLNYVLGRLLVRCAFITLPNLIAGRPVMPEFVFKSVTAPEVEAMTAILRSWLSDSEIRAANVAELERLCQSAAVPGATARAVDALLERLSGPALSKPGRRSAA